MEFITSIDAIGIDGKVTKTFQKVLTKQAFIFKLEAKVMSGKKDGRWQERW